MEVESTDIWTDDLLDRKAEAQFLLRFLQNKSAERSASNKSGSYVLNLDGGWGEGKTFFLTHFQKQIEQDGFIPVYVNSWKDDFADDPMIAVMSAIDNTLKAHLSTRGKAHSAWKKARKSGLRIATKIGSSALKAAAQRYIGPGFGEALDLWADKAPESLVISDESKRDIADTAIKAIDKFVDKKTEDALKKFDENKRSIEEFKTNLDAFLQTLEEDTHKILPLFILVDELDRCRPTYAISTLERVKHFFEIKNVVFVIATDSEQLKHSIKAVYGQDFDSGRYLLRFFDRTYKFMKPELKNYIDFLTSNNPIAASKYSLPLIGLNDLLKVFSINLGLRLRDIEQIYDHLQNVITAWDHKVPMQMAYLLPLVVSYHQGKQEVFESLEKMADNEHISNYFGKVGVIHQRLRRGSDGRVETDRASYSDLLSRTMAFAKKDLDKIGREDHRTHFILEIAQQFMNEFAILHDNTIYHNRAAPTSIIGEYSSYVRSAGRIIPSGAPEEA